MPIHSTQIILKDDSERLKIAIEVKINKELLAEILSFGEQVKTLKPATNNTQLRELFVKMLSNVT